MNQREVHQAPDAERTVLGTVFLDSALIWEARTVLGIGDFSLPSHAMVFDAMCTLADRRERPDLVPVTEFMRMAGTLDRAGGAAFLGRLADHSVTTVGFDGALRAVRDASLLRKLWRFGQQIVARTRADVDDVAALAAEIEAEALALCRVRSTHEPETIRAVAREVLEDLDRVADAGGGLTGISTGFSKLDYWTDGLHNSDLIIIGGRASMGKSGFGVEMAMRVANAGVPVMIFSLEMSNRQVVRRQILARARVPFRTYRSGAVTEDHRRATYAAADEVSRLGVILDETPGLTVPALISKARAARQQHGIGLILIDYLQLMRSPARHHVNREREIGEISQSLKELAKTLDIPVIALSQLNRATDAREDKRPRLADLRDSGSLEQDADVVILLYRDEYYDPNTKEPGIAEVILAKQRNEAQNVTVKLGYRADLARFYELEEGARDVAA